MTPAKIFFVFLITALAAVAMVDLMLPPFHVVTVEANKTFHMPVAAVHCTISKLLVTPP